jgi:hypothetical protein
MAYRGANAELFEKVIEKVAFPNFPMPITLRVRGGGLHISICTADRDNANKPTIFDFHEEIPPWFQGPADVQTVLEWIMETVKKAMDHELEEHFQFDGMRLLDPHAPRQEVSNFRPDAVIDDLFKGPGQGKHG